MSDSQSNSLHERTLSGIKQVLVRALDHVDGLEKVVVRRAIEILQPRVENRIRAAQEADLREELKYLHALLGAVLQEPSRPKTTKRKAKVKQTKRANLRR
ncbi:hypothetical protein LLE49_26900 [Alicyclobacillus tolerans]|uniref:hypothetical protein n=1 Tax=Alicyclobacillus tolerans TaxID=90970 RepID=UPI001F400E4D|nr:hypothetical protein [Alicyclobacillus tolerans]MCF8568353.1 hypothetical protein [Alicyclobacillus tolerans]